LNGSSQRLTIPEDTHWTFRAIVSGITDEGDVASYSFEGAISNIGMTTSIAGSVIKTVIAEDNALFDCNISADDTNDSLKIAIQVSDGTVGQMRWVARIETSEVTFPAAGAGSGGSGGSGGGGSGA
jgi:hypothetical protein